MTDYATLLRAVAKTRVEFIVVDQARRRTDPPG